ncbi:anti-sigma factor domain-containing protein [Aciduricibacillus chroicocephali]|uniref:Anti-sigma factor domain-containing protein n=1 Tax=Aciduricibacillus chroicocephali TaxID=3054939 RepID=A0ABY9KXM3_9BACI|nr:anti-sigma factor domain-containing protein [Bacillaceae bacterium 44XB]
MSKGLVMEKHRKYMIVLTSDGMFQKAVPQDCAELGEEVDFEPLTEKRRKLVLPSIGRFGIPVGIAAAVILLLIVMPFFPQPGKELKTYAYVSIDINPSIELQVDESMRVKKLTPLNEDAKTVQASLGDYKGEDIAKVVDDIMIKSEEKDLTAHGKKMLVGVSYANSKDSDKASVLDHLRDFFRTDAPDWKVASYKLPKDLRKTAHEEKLSANELLAKKLYNSDNYASLSKKDIEIIHSFYQKKNKEAEEAKLMKKAKQEKESEKTQETVKQEQEKKDEQSSSQKVVNPPASYEPQSQSNSGQSKGTTQPSGSSGSNTKNTSGSSYSGSSSSKTQQPSTPNKNNNSSSNVNRNQENNYYRDQQNNNQDNSNNNQHYDYRNNNPYRNKDYNQYKNHGEQYHNQYQNQDDDEDDDD